MQLADYIVLTFVFSMWIDLISIQHCGCGFEIFSIRQNPITNDFRFRTFPDIRNPLLGSHLSMCRFLEVIHCVLMSHQR